MEDTSASGADVREGVQVQVLPGVPTVCIHLSVKYSVKYSKKRTVPNEKISEQNDIFSFAKRYMPGWRNWQTRRT